MSLLMTLKIPSKSVGNAMDLPWKNTEIFMGFGFVVCNENANYLCFKMELHRVLL